MRWFVDCPSSLALLLKQDANGCTDLSIFYWYGRSGGGNCRYWMKGKNSDICGKERENIQYKYNIMQSTHMRDFIVLPNRMTLQLTSYSLEYVCIPCNLIDQHFCVASPFYLLHVVTPLWWTTAAAAAAFIN